MHAVCAAVAAAAAAALRKDTATVRKDTAVAAAAVVCAHSRCTGYRPILDAFKIFAKAEPGAYAAEAIAAARGMAAADALDNGSTPAGASGTRVCPSSGLPCDCGGGVTPSSGVTSSTTASAEKPCGGGAGGCGKGGCGIAPATNGAATSNGAATNGAASLSNSEVKLAASAEPIFPRELKGRPAAALVLPGALLIGCS